jgi:hypothetical protein
MHFHPLTACGAGDDPFQFATVQRSGNCIGTPKPRPPVAHDGGERLARQQDAIAVTAVLDTLVVHQALPQCHTALRAGMLPGAAEGEDAIRIAGGIGQRML